MTNIVLFCLLTLSSVAFAGGIKGKVLIEKGKTPAVGANVKIQGTAFGTSVNADGSFIISDLKKGVYSAEISHVGYETHIINNIIVEADSYTFTETILIESQFRLNEIVITAALNPGVLKDSPTSIEIIGKKEITSFRTSTLSDVMQNQTGIELSYGMGKSVSAQLNGLSDYHVLVLIDGEKPAGKVDGAVNLSSIPVNSIEKIEIVKGPMSSIYGSDAIGGVINIFTKNPSEKTSIFASSTYGTYERIDNYFRAGRILDNIFGENSSLGVSIVGGWNKFGGVDYDPGDNFTETPKSDQKNASLKTNLSFNEKFCLNLKGDYLTEEKSWFDKMQMGPSTVLLTDKSLDKKLSVISSANYIFSQNAALKISGNYSYNDHRFNETSGARNYEDNSKEYFQNYKAQLISTVINNSVLTVGYEFENERLKSDRIIDNNKNYKTNSAFFETEWKYFPFIISVGGRYANNHVYGNFFSPKTGVLVKISDGLSFRASYGKGFRAPSIKELYLDFSMPAGRVLGVPTLQPEKSDGFNFGAQYSSGTSLWIRANGFYNSLSNLINYYVIASGPPPFILTYQNILKAKIYGFDADINYAPLKTVMITLGYNHTTAKDNDGNRLLFRTPNSINFKIDCAYEPLDANFSLRGRWFDKKPVTDEETNLNIYSAGGANVLLFNVPAYAIFDFTFSKKLFVNFEIFAGINNIENKTYFPYGQIRGREFFGGVSAEF